MKDLIIYLCLGLSLYNFVMIFLLINSLKTTSYKIKELACLFKEYHEEIEEIIEKIKEEKN